MSDLKNFTVPVPDEVKESFDVSASRRLENGSTGDVGPLIRLELGSKGIRMMPLRGVSDGIDTVRRMLEGRLNPNLPSLTLAFEGKTYVLTLADLKLVQREE